MTLLNKEDYFRLTQENQIIPDVLKPMMTKLAETQFFSIYDVKPILDGNEGFGFTVVFAKVSWANAQVKDTMKKIVADKSTPLTSQPCSMFGQRCHVEGSVAFDAKEGFSYPVATEIQTLYGLRPEILEIKKHVELIFGDEDPWTKEYSNWVMRSGMSVIKQTHAMRMNKLNRPYQEDVYKFITTGHNSVVRQKERLEEVARIFSIVFNNVAEVRTWGIPQWITDLSPNAKTKESGPQFATFLNDVCSDILKQRLIDGANEFIIEENQKAGVSPGHGGMELIPSLKNYEILNETEDPENEEVREDEGYEKVPIFKWNWRFQHLLFTSPFVQMEDKNEVLSHTQLWYRRMTSDVWALQLLEFSNIRRVFPDDWNEQHVMIIIPKRIQGVVRGSRDSCEVASIKWNIPKIPENTSYADLERILDDASLEVTVTEDAQRIVVRELTTVAATKALRSIIDAVNEMTGNMVVTSGKLMAKAIALSKAGADGSAMDSVTGAIMGLTWYGKAWKQRDSFEAGLWMLSTGMGSGRPETMAFNSWLLYHLHVYAKTNMHLVYIVGDDQGFSIYPVTSLIEQFNHALNIPETFEFIKTKQTKRIGKQDRWLNFVLGITTVWQSGILIKCFRALKTIATKQTPTGTQKRNVFATGGWDYWEERDTITVSDIWKDQKVLYVCNKPNELIEYLSETSLELLLATNPDAPGFIVAMTM